MSRTLEAVDAALPFQSYQRRMHTYNSQLKRAPKRLLSFGVAGQLPTAVQFKIQGEPQLREDRPALYL